jgi:drug/metabolite transporter (DMT)-like permease
MMTKAHPVKHLFEDKISLILFSILSTMWGFTWLMGKYQVHNNILPEIAVSYRLLGVSFLMFLILKFKKQSFKLQKSDFKTLFIFAIFCTSIHLIFFYYAAKFMITSISALVFSFLVILTALIKYFLKLTPERLMPIIISAVIGVLGLLFISFQKFYNIQVGIKLVIGICFAFVGTFLYSLGSVFYETKRASLKISPLPSFFYTSAFGAIISFLIAVIHSLLNGEALNLMPNISISFIFSYLYLVVSGFGVLITMILIQRIGAIQTSYTNFITPVIAIFVSAIFEDYQILPATIIGITLIILSNYIAFFKRKA